MNMYMFMADIRFLYDCLIKAKKLFNGVKRIGMLKTPVGPVKLYRHSRLFESIELPCPCLAHCDAYD